MKVKNIKKYGIVFFRRILLISLSIMLFLSVTVSIIISVILTDSSIKSVEEIETSYADRISQNCINALTSMSSISNYFSTLQTLPFDYVDKTTNVWMKNIMNSTLNSYQLNYNYIVGIKVDIANYAFSTGNYSKFDATVLSEYNGVNISLCKNDVEWPHYVYFESVPNNYSTNKTSLLINVEKFAKGIFLNSGSSRNDYIITRDGTILLSNNDAQNFANIKDFYKIESYDNNFTQYKSQENSYYITSKSVEGTPFFYISVVDTNFYYGATRSALINSIIFGIVITMLSLSITFVIVHFNYRPIKNIVSIINSYYPEDEIDENEINFIKNHITRTIEDKQSLEKQLPETVKKLNHAQIAALHSQMNPHFLFNTLENIVGISIEKYGVDNDIEKSIILLNKVLYESISQKNMLFSIGNEIEITKNYIQLMHLRFGNRFSTIWDIDESVLNAKILKFSLQPIVENSIIKGFTKKRTDYVINIDIKRLNGDIIIRITDNGIGMSQQDLERLKESISNTEESEKHIGLKNLNIRSKLLYGTNYGISKIESSTSGTSVELIIPLLLE